MAVNPFEAFKERSKKRWKSSITLASELPSQACKRISTGNFGLDIATYGGIPRGRISRFWGTPRSTKTGSCLNAVVEWQKHCCFCFSRDPCKCKKRAPAGALWVDAEGKLADDLMIPWMLGHGVNLDALLFERPDSGEEIIDAVDDAIRQGIGLIVIDSIAHMVTKAEIQKAAEDGDLPGRGAKLINKAMRKWVLAITQRGFEDVGTVPTLLIINQVRGTFDQYAPETLPGGRGQEFATSLDVRFYSSKSRRRYRSVKEDGSFSDLKKPITPDSAPDYQETDYRITTSSMCPAGRYGTYNYWTLPSHGRRKGDPDNAAMMVVYMNRYKWFRKVKGGYAIHIPDEWVKDDGEKEPILFAPKKDPLIQLFRGDAVVQAKVRSVFIRELCRD